MITWICKSFDALGADELYAILRLRNEVFVVEQNCVFQDADNNDQACFHIMGWQQNKLAAYARLVAPGIIYQEPGIGRVVVVITARGSGIGRELLQRAIAECRKRFGNGGIRIGAQVQLQAFYQSLGFVPTGGIYPEDGIEHIQMLLS